jgi:hypothetical protein
MPVPTVMYSDESTSCDAPQRCSPIAATLTSVSKPTGTPSARTIAPRRSVFCQASLGVEVM